MTDNDNSDIKRLSQCQSLNYKTWSLQILLEETVPQIPSFLEKFHCFEILLSNIFWYFESNASIHGPCPVQHECCDEFKAKIF